jgi:hypothetical protein
MVSTPSNIPKIIKDIFSASMTALRSYDYDKEKVHSDLVVVLMHYLLTACVIPSERKVEYNKGLILDVVIPSTRQLKTDPKRTLLLVFPKKSEPASISAQTDSLLKVQPNKENVWLVFGHYSDELISVCEGFKRYIPDDFSNEALKPLSSIIDDIKLFLDVNKIKSFRIFPT